MHRPDVLLLTHRVPYPPDKGDRIRTFNLLRFLSRHAAVHLASLADEPVPDETRRVLQRYCQRVAIAPLGSSRWLGGFASLARGGSISEGVFRSSELARTLKTWAADTPFRAAVASASSVAPYLRIGQWAKVPAVVDLVDVDSQKWLDYAATSRFPRTWLYRLEGNRLRKAERKIAEWARAVTLVSEAEARLFRLGRSRLRAPSYPQNVEIAPITNGVDLDYFHPESEPEPINGCVFVGAFDYRPNVDAACWFAREIWPGIRERHPDARFRLVGRNPAKAVRQLGSIAGVDVVGTVPDVRPFVREAAVVVAPLRIARGLQNKVLEALAMGKAVVASPQALAGFRDDVPAVTAVDRSGWIEAVSRLMMAAEERRLLGESGRTFAETYHDWDHCLEPFRDLLGLGIEQSAPLEAVEAT